MTRPEFAQHHALGAAHLAALAPHARRLAEILGGLSVVVFGEPWRDLLEHDVWEAVQNPEADRAALGLDALTCAELRDLAHQARGWVMWSDGPRFVPAPTWGMFHAVWRMARPGKL